MAWRLPVLLVPLLLPVLAMVLTHFNFLEGLFAHLEFLTDIDRDVPVYSRAELDAGYEVLESLSDAEVQLFEEADDWWETEHGKWVALHQINAYRVEYIAGRLRRRFLEGGAPTASSASEADSSQGPSANPSFLYGPRFVDFDVREGVEPRTGTFLRGLEVLEVGCGAGVFSLALARLGATVVCTEAVSGALESAKRHLRARGVRWVEDEGLKRAMGMAPTDLGEPAAEPVEGSPLTLNVTFLRTTDLRGLAAARRFRAVVALEVVEHVALGHQERFVHDLMALLDPDPRAEQGGPSELILMTETRKIRAFLEMVVTAEYLLRSIPIGAHDYRKFVRPEELAEMVASFPADAAAPSSGGHAADAGATAGGPRYELAEVVPTTISFLANARERGAWPTLRRVLERGRVALLDLFVAFNPDAPLTCGYLASVTVRSNGAR